MMSLIIVGMSILAGFFIWAVCHGGQKSARERAAKRWNVSTEAKSLPVCGNCGQWIHVSGCMNDCGTKGFR